MKERLFAAGMRQHSGIGIVDEHLKWNTAQEFEGVLMSAQEMFGRGVYPILRTGVSARN